jgi:hypothetical protein
MKIESLLKIILQNLNDLKSNKFTGSLKYELFFNDGGIRRVKSNREQELKHIEETELKKFNLTS